MELTVDQALQQGVAAHKEGNLQDAERLYRAILQAQPNHPDANHNLGLVAVAVGKPLEAIPLFKQALKTNPQIEQFWLSYIGVLITVERFDEAKRVLVEGEKFGVASEKLKLFHQQIQTSPSRDKKNTKKGLAVSEKRKRLAEKKKSKNRKAGSSSTKAEPSQDQLDRLLAHYQAGRLEEAEELATLLSQQFPKYPFGWKVLGAVFKQMGRVNESLLPMQKSADLSPQDAEAHSNLGVTLKELGRLDEAEASYKQAIALKPDFAEARNNLGITLKDLGRLDEAEASYKQAIALKPDFAEAHNNLGNTLKELGRLDEAEASFRKAIALKPDYAEAHNNLGITLKELDRLDDAEAGYRKAIALKPDFAEAHNNLGITLKELGRLDDAEAGYRRAIVLKPDFAEAHDNLGNTLQQLGKLDDAEASFRKAIALKPDYAEAHHNLTTIKKFSSQDKQLFERLKASYPRIAGHTFEPTIVASEPTPIFIVGMPRSGTTLVEQIISSHPLVTGAGEHEFVSQFGSSLAVDQTPVDGEALTIFRKQYLNALKQRSEGNAIVTDKMPHNFRFLGLIARALPESKIIHVKRDPAAVCWANYTKYFVKDSLEYCYDLDDIRHYHELYRDLMKYWHQALPNRIYDLDYEALTERQEEETHNLIDYLALEWDDACLSPQDNTRSVATASNVQVRQKVYQGSSERWKPYKPYLNGALDHFSADNQ